MLPKKKLIDRARESGALAQIDILLSASNILSEIAATLVGEADDTARGCGLMLGEVKHAANRLEASRASYALLWKDLLREGGQERERMDDYLSLFAPVCRLLGLQGHATDPSTGKPVGELPATAWGEGGQSARLRAHAIRDVLERGEGGRMEYRSGTLTEGQRGALGAEVNITFRSHENLSRLFSAFSEAHRRPKRDLLNEALLEYMDNHKDTL